MKGNHLNSGLRLWTVLCLCFCGVQAIMAQALQVSGTVIEKALNEPMLGVSVVEKGTTNGTTTDLNGQFSLSTHANATLVFSFIGYTTVEQKAVATMNILMEEDRQNLEEVVVVGYGVQKKSSLTGAVSQLKQSDLTSRSASSATSLLAGKTAGVAIRSTSAAPGAAANINIRGFASTYSSAPLYVIDGRQATDMDGIDPNDIESIEVLKDAASASIYGAQAGNGVILVTTKKGRGKGRISYGYQFVSESLAHKPELLSAQEFYDYWTTSGVKSDNDFRERWDGKTDTDWFDVAFETGYKHRHNLTFDSSTDKGNIYVSATYLTNDGIVSGQNDTYERTTAMLNMTQSFKPWLSLSMNTQVEYKKVHTISEGGYIGNFFNTVLQMEPTTKSFWTYDELPADFKQALAQGQHLIQNEDGLYYPNSRFNDNNVHPLLSTVQKSGESRTFNLNNTTALTLKPFKGFSFTSRMGFIYTGRSSYNRSDAYYGGTGKQEWDTAGGMSAYSIYTLWENFANYNLELGKNSFGVMAGTSFSHNRTFDVTGNISGYLGDDGSVVNGFQSSADNYRYMNYKTAAAKQTVSGGEPLTNNKLSYFGRINYDYEGRYMAEFSLRADAADLSYLSAKQRWGYFPGVSVGWTLSQEKFMEKTNGWLPFAKIRASWGQNGSLSNLGSYLYRSVIQANDSYPFGNALADGVIANAPAKTGNDELRWETSEQLDLGLDLHFLANRLSVTVDYYNKKTKDLIMTSVKPSLIVGNTASPVNAGDMVNKGVELELGWNDRIGDFTYSLRGSFAKNSNEVTAIHPSLQSGIEGDSWSPMATSVTRFEVGHPAWYFYGYKFLGMNQETGEPIFEDLDGQPGITDSDRTDIGCGMPTLNYGITLNLGWKNLEFTVFGQGSAGADLLLATARTDFVTNLYKASTQNAWTPNNHSGDKPTWAAGQGYQHYLMSSGNLYSGNYFKFRQIELAYNCPKELIRKVSLSNARFSVSLEDFFTITNYPGMDPETTGNPANPATSRGVDYGSFPSSKKVMVGVNLSF